MNRHSKKMPLGVFPFSGQLIDGGAAANWLLTKTANAPGGVCLCSAFLRSEAINKLYPSCNSVRHGRILVRWRLGDLLSGASDLEAYPLAKRLGFDFYVRQDFHGKVYSIPGSGIIVGSANATLSGFGLKEASNSEVCTLVPHSEANQDLLDKIFEGAVEITDSLFLELSSVFQSSASEVSEEINWPSDLLDRLLNNEFVGGLLLSECLVSVPLRDGNGLLTGVDQRDFDLLGINAIDTTCDVASRAFKATRIYHWLVSELRSSGGELYFGALVAALHNTLLDDPMVYRRDVKTVLQTLLQWCQVLSDVGVIIDRPSYSQRIRIR